jgi:hypothetical protein
VTGERPAIVVRCAGPDAVLRAVLAGIEEEGVPASVVPDAGDTVAMAHRAACESPLGVGVGIGATGAVCVHHAKLDPASPPLYSEDADAGRHLGHNAARIVTVIPLIPLRS